MKPRLYLNLLLAACLLIVHLTGQNMHFDKDGMAVINGQRKFILGLYENPADDNMLKLVSKAGFNIIGVSAKDSATTNQYLERLAGFHLGAWISGNTDLSLDTEKRQTNLVKMVRRFATHPAFYGRSDCTSTYVN